MKFRDLGNYDSSLTLRWPSSWEEEILGLTTVNEPRDGRLVFIKNQVYWEKFYQGFKTPDLQKMGLVMEDNLWKSLEQKTLDKIGFVATSSDVSLSMCKISKLFYEQKRGCYQDMVDGRQMNKAEIHPTAWIAQGAFIGEKVKIAANVKIHPQVVILSGSEIGENTEIFPNVTIYHNVKVGKSCRINAGAILGCDGFGYYFKQGTHHKIWHMGGLQLEDSVEIGANTTIDGGTFSKTSIGEGSKIGQGVMVSHNCQLGKGVILCGHNALGGSVVIGDYCFFGGQSAVRENCSFGDRCQIAGSASVTCSWPSGSVIGGYPARPMNEWLKGLGYLRRKSRQKEK
ncbi:MAG: UDP-3-O-(3-hydroxymyristoyl)glucosamine N-acyltransferase [Halobacteriovoraceae bacterium]|nr:UDP-3-O-(3-hydroxymyristoyl)glucosamine N-acyltransferase [Halobacteriovoraceae bacterium]